MDKSEALKLLKEALEEVPALLKLRHADPKRNLWIYRMEDIIKVGFGPNSDEFKRFFEGVPRDELWGSDSELQKWLDSRLERRAIIIRSIIEKHELLGEEGEHAEGEENIKAELEQFRDGLMKYKEIVLAERERQIDFANEPQQEEEFHKLKSALEQKYGQLQRILDKYGGPTDVLLGGGKYKFKAFPDVFGYTQFDPGAFQTVADRAIAAVNIAIGSLKEESFGKPSKYELTSLVYWTERFYRLKPLATFVGWLKTFLSWLRSPKHLIFFIVGLVGFIAAIITIVRTFF